jgi:SAM-dependent methyltransferase
MPGQQGVMAWPVGQPNVSVLCAESQWPVATGSVDRLVIMHGLETSEHPAAMLEESQRVLAPGGKALFIVPNRSGLWARRDGTPFGFGRPFSLGQIESQLRDHGFTPERHVAALFAPPSNRRFWLRTAQMWEQVGRRLSARFAGGVLMVEAGKEVPARPRPGLGAAVRRPLRVLDGIPMPDPKPT